MLVSKVSGVLKVTAWVLLVWQVGLVVLISKVSGGITGNWVILARQVGLVVLVSKVSGVLKVTG